MPQATFAFPWLESAGPFSYQKITIKRSFKTYFVKERKRLACVTTWRTQLFCKNNIWHSVNREKLAPQEKNWIITNISLLQFCSYQWRKKIVKINNTKCERHHS